MTQSEEALEMMSCRRCGRFSGAELLCPACDDAVALERQLEAENDALSSVGEREAQEVRVRLYDTSGEWVFEITRPDEWDSPAIIVYEGFGYVRCTEERYQQASIMTIGSLE